MMLRTPITVLGLCLAMVGCGERETKEADHGADEVAALTARLEALEGRGDAAALAGRVEALESALATQKSQDREEVGVVKAREFRVVDEDGDPLIILRGDGIDPEIVIVEDGDERLVDLTEPYFIPNGPPTLDKPPTYPGDLPEETVPDISDDVVKVGALHTAVLRSGLDEQLKDLGVLGRQARVIPNYDSETGTYKGFKLVGVRPNSLYQHLGFRSGDIILAVNNTEMNSPNRALELFTQMQVQPKLIVSLNRRGKAETLRIDIVDELPKGIPVQDAVDNSGLSDAEIGPSALPQPTDTKSRYDGKIANPSPYSWIILRSWLNEELEDLDGIGRQARVIPNYEKDIGAYNGFKLVGVRPNSLYRALGIRSGDVIKKINGEELDSPSKVLDLYTRLKEESRIVLSISRRGQPQDLSYHIVDELPESPPAALDEGASLGPPPIE